MRYFHDKIEEFLDAFGIAEVSFGEYVKRLRRGDIVLKESGNVAVGINLENSSSDYICYYCLDLMRDLGSSLTYRPSVLKEMRHSLIPGCLFKLYRLSNEMFKMDDPNDGKLRSLLGDVDRWVDVSSDEADRLRDFVRRVNRNSVKNKVVQEKYFFLKKELEKRGRDPSHRIERVMEKLFGFQMEIEVSKYVAKRHDDYHVLPYYDIGKSVDLILCTKDFKKRVYVDVKASKFYRLFPQR